MSGLLGAGYAVSTEFARKVPEWFLPARPANHELRGLDAMLFGAWTTQRARDLNAQLGEAPKAIDAMRAVASSVCSLVIPRRLARRSAKDSVHESDFLQTRYARLVFGHTNCEGGSHLALVLLRALGFNSHLIETGVKYSHVIVLVLTEEGWGFVDVHSDFPIYQVSGFQPSVALRDPGLCALRPMTDVPAYSSFGFPEGAIIEHGLYPESELQDGIELITRRFGSQSRPSMGAARELLAKRSEVEGSGTQFLSEFLTTRTAHVWAGSIDSARYSELLTRHRLRGYTRALVLYFAEGQREEADSLAS